MKLKIGFIGIDKHSEQHVWGYAYNDDENGIHLFWGRKNGNMRFTYSIRDNVFFRNVRKKKKVYRDIKDSSMAENVKEQYSQYMLLRKLKYE